MTLREAIRSEIQIDKDFFKRWGQATKEEWENEPVNKAAATVVDGGFNIIAWFTQNWQLAVVGLVALLILLKD